MQYIKALLSMQIQHAFNLSLILYGKNTKYVYNAN
jgi:hypothetical protein